MKALIFGAVQRGLCHGVLAESPVRTASCAVWIIFHLGRYECESGAKKQPPNTAPPRGFRRVARLRRSKRLRCVARLWPWKTFCAFFAYAPSVGCVLLRFAPCLLAPKGLLNRMLFSKTVAEQSCFRC